MNSTGADPPGESRDWFRQAAADKGAGWEQYDFAAYSAICLLYLVEWARWDSQAAVGKGYVQEGGMPLAAGGTDAMVYHTGRAAGTDGETAVQYRWLENLWGNVAQWVDGFNTQDGQVYVCLDPQQWQDAVAQGYQAGVVMPGAGWITSFSPGQLGWALLPRSGGGPERRPRARLHRRLVWARTVGAAIVGGMCGDGDKAGLFTSCPISISSMAISSWAGMQFLPHCRRVQRSARPGFRMEPGMGFRRAGFRRGWLSPGMAFAGDGSPGLAFAGPAPPNPGAGGSAP